jgi:hypothetical protein
MEREYWVTDYIKYFENIVAPQICDDVKNGEFQYEVSAYSTHDSGKVVKQDRVVSEDFWIRSGKPYHAQIKPCYRLAIDKYREEFPHFNVQHLTDFRISRYSKGGFMSKHVDNIHHSHGQQWGYPQVTVLLFLNDDYKGGEIVISGRKFETKAGSAIVFPSNFMFPHEVLKVTEGTRYSITCWLM